MVVRLGFRLGLRALKILPTYLQTGKPSPPKWTCYYLLVRESPILKNLKVNVKKREKKA